jgi:hypothetical protein
MLEREVNFKTYKLNPCFTPVCFTPFCFNAPCQFTPLLNLHSLILVLRLFGWFLAFKSFLWAHPFDLRPLFQERC